MLLNASTSSADCKPPVICTVAEASVALSASATVAPLSITTAVEAPSPLASVHAVVPAVSVTTGGVSTAVILTVVVAGVLFTVPSLTTQLMVRLLSLPKLVGLWLLEANVTLSSTAW